MNIIDKTDEEIRNLRRGGHDYRKLYSAYSAATQPNGRPTVILAKTVKGWTLGSSVEARNITHQAKKMGDEEEVDELEAMELRSLSLAHLSPGARDARAFGRG